jgi:uncharacterized membrane protein
MAMFGLNLSLVGWVHTIVSVAAMLAFVPVMLARKGGRRHRRFGRVYALAYVGVCITSLGIYSLQRFWFPHWLAIGGLAVLVVGYSAARLKPRGWRYIHLSAMLLSAYNLFGGAVNEAYLRVRPFRELAGDDLFASPLVGTTHGLVMLVFVLLIGGYVAVTIVDQARRGQALTGLPSIVIESTAAAVPFAPAEGADRPRSS